MQQETGKIRENDAGRKKRRVWQTGAVRKKNRIRRTGAGRKKRRVWQIDAGRKTGGVKGDGMMNEGEERFERVLKKIESYRESMVEDLSGLIRCKSTPSAPEDGAPFGRGVAEALSTMLEMGRREGFSVFNADGYGGHIDYGESEQNGIMGILCHLDVVAEGNGWSREPFGGVVEEGVVYGRGALDDKGPAIAAFYAVKALKDCGILPEKKIRMVFGLDEETGSSGMDYYRRLVKMPDFSIVPDADFPLVNGEMGILTFDLVKKTGKADKRGISLKRLSGGNAPNIVPDAALAVVSCEAGYEEIRRAAERFEESFGFPVETKRRGKSLEILCRGKSAHGAMPWKGTNAVSVLMKFLGELDFDCSGVSDFIRFYNRHIGFDLEGGSIGCGLQDEISGKLIWNTGLLSMDREALSVTVNVRCPVSFSDEDVYAAMRPVLEEFDIGVVKTMYKPPLYYDPDSPLIRTLLSVYRDRTGDLESPPLVIGGGTYAREAENAVAFGALYPGDPDIMHEPDECIRIDRLVLTAQIYADAVYRLACGGECGARDAGDASDISDTSGISDASDN